MSSITELLKLIKKYSRLAMKIDKLSLEKKREAIIDMEQFVEQFKGVIHEKKYQELKSKIDEKKKEYGIV